ncbi:MAG TPA: VTT domain-containing protein [Terriglobales bacterium]|nr:VTT domain-containing protein [Terriglobales bacterium]
MLPHGHGWLDGIFYFFIALGAPGLVILGVLDSSFLTLPFANDLAVIVLVSLHHEWTLLYVAAATAGSVAGCWIMFEIGHAGGENFIRAHMSEQRYRRIHAAIGKKGPVLLAVPALIPPPFPFSAFVLGAGALEVPRKPFLAMLAAMRAARFLAEAVAALYWGRGIVRQMQTPGFRLFIELLVVLAFLASAFSLYELVHGSRRGARHTGAK